MTVDVIEKAVCGLNSCMIAIEGRDEVLDESDVVQRCTKDDFKACRGKILVQFVIDVRPFLSATLAITRQGKADSL